MPFLFFTLSLASAQIDWTAYYGCYQTLSYNGQAMPSSTQNIGQINFQPTSQLLRELDDQDIASHSLYLFKGEQNGVANFLYQDIFVNKGREFRDGEFLSHEFKGKLLFSPQSSNALVVDYQSLAQLSSADQSTIRAYLKSSLTGPFTIEEEGEFLLKKITCPK